MKYLLLSGILLTCLVHGTRIAQGGPLENSLSPWISPGIGLNNEGAQKIIEQDAVAAIQKLTAALAESPYAPEIHFNLGLALTIKGDPEGARASYLSALKLLQNQPLPNSELAFRVLFNLGELSGKNKEIDQALGYYQRALDIHPDSVEVKTNIELLTQDQQGEGKGEGKSSDQNKDEKSGKGQGKNKDDKNDSEENDEKNKKDGEGDDESEPPKEYGKNPKPDQDKKDGKGQPKPFKSEELSQSDVNKILGEIKQQEQKIRAEFNRKDAKERPRDKNW